MTKHHSTVLFVVFLALSLQCLLAPSASSQTPAGASVGIFGSYGHNLHSTDMRSLPDVPNCCPQFSTGNGGGYSGGIMMDVPLFDAFGMRIRIDHTTHDAHLRAPEILPVSLNGAAVPARIEHEIDARISSVGIQPLFTIRLHGPLSIHVGPRVSAILTNRYDQRETLIEPGGSATFENLRRTRNERLNEIIPSTQAWHVGALTGLSASYPLDHASRFVLVPELSVSYGFTDLVSARAWKSHDVRVGVGVLYALFATPSLPAGRPDDPEPYTPPVTAGRLVAGLRAVALDDQGVEHPVAEIHVEEILSRQLKPLLPFVFFDHKSAVIPQRYARLRSSDAERFQTNQLHRAGTMPTYYHLLNIVGERLRAHGDARLTITGCTDGRIEEMAQPTLALSRAEAVAEYLTSVWNIDRRRLSITARAYPVHPSAMDDVDGAEENRRVELSSDTWEILRPVQTQETLRTVTPPTLRFLPDVHHTHDLSSCTIEILHPGSSRPDVAVLGTRASSFDWTLNTAQSPTPDAGYISGVLRVTDVAGRAAEARTEIPVRVSTITRRAGSVMSGRTIDRYALILFAFDSPELDASHRRIMNDMIIPEIRPGAAVSILGSTDRIGFEHYNRALSDLRARSVAQELRIPSMTRGKGEHEPPYSNDLPEGRCYNRTVEITVETRSP